MMDLFEVKVMDSTTIDIVCVIMLVLFMLLWLYTLRRRISAEGKFNAAEQELGKVRERFASVISADDELARILRDLEEMSGNLEELRLTYKGKRQVLEELERQVAIFNEQISFAEFGVYEPHFDFTDSDQFKQEIKVVCDQQKAMISAKTATVCPTDWTVDGSLSKGETMINRQTRLALRAFNSECGNAIVNTRWNNALAMEKRISNAAKQINNANASMSLRITQAYVDLKLDELRITHEYRENLKVEREKRIELARAQREEQKLIKEAEAMERKECEFHRLLDKARKEVGIDESRIIELETALAAAQKEAERARAMAERTKSGYVYIISNIGCFGEDVFKIGLTRRLDPDDRVRELGDASVPFSFDTHAMIYSEEAPNLEAALHREFTDRRVNAANLRKEFFRVSLEEVEEAVRRLAPDAIFFKDREAQEWHETLARRKQVLSDIELPSEQFPAEI